MTLQPKYFSEKDTPITYYKVLKMFVIIWIIVSAGRIVYFMSEGNLFGVIEMLIALTIYICVAIGLYKKQWSGVVALYFMFAFDILDVLVALGIYVYYGIADASILGQIAGNIIGILIWAIPTWVYFSKRRPLFTPYKENMRTVYQATESTYTTIVGEQSKSIEREALNITTNTTNEVGIVQQKGFCVECGEKLINDSKFCYKCGKEVIQVTDEQKNEYEKYHVCIFDVETGTLRKEMRDVDVVKFPPSKFSANNTYYAIETIRDSKKVRIYYEKNNWYKQIENSLQINGQITNVVLNGNKMEIYFCKIMC